MVNRDDAVVLGLGQATLTAVGGATPLVVRHQAEGVVLAGLTVDAGTELSPTLVHIQGQPGNKQKPRTGTPSTTLNDVYIRVGGPHIGKADTSLRIDADDVLIDHSWVSGRHLRHRGLHRWGRGRHRSVEHQHRSRRSGRQR